MTYLRREGTVLSFIRKNGVFLSFMTLVIQCKKLLHWYDTLSARTFSQSSVICLPRTQLLPGYLYFCQRFFDAKSFIWKVLRCGFILLVFENCLGAFISCFIGFFVCKRLCSKTLQNLTLKTNAGYDRKRFIFLRLQEGLLDILLICFKIRICEECFIAFWNRMNRWLIRLIYSSGILRKFICLSSLI